MHAWHVESSLNLLMLQIHQHILTDPLVFVLKAELLLEDDDNPGTERGTQLPIKQVIVFPFCVNRGVSPFFHSYEHPCSWQSLPSDRTAGVSWSNCTVTNGSRS